MIYNNFAELVGKTPLLKADGFDGIEDIINSAKYLEGVMQNLNIK